MPGLAFLGKIDVIFIMHHIMHQASSFKAGAEASARNSVSDLEALFHWRLMFDIMPNRLAKFCQRDPKS